MKNTEFFDKVKDYFKNGINQLKTDKKSRNRFIIVSCVEFVLLAITLVLDLCLKEYVCDFLMEKGGNHTFIKGFLDLTYSENTGAGFGMFKDGTLALSIITSIVIFAIFAYLLISPRKDLWLRIALVFIAGGGIGNLVDRIGLKYVRDFLEFTFTDKWAIFNVADCFVTVGAVMMIIYLIWMIVKEFVDSKKNKSETNDETDDLTILNDEKTAEDGENLDKNDVNNESMTIAENCENDQTAVDSPAVAETVEENTIAEEKE